MYLLARSVIKFLHLTTCSLSSKSKKNPDGFPINSNPKKDTKDWSPFFCKCYLLLVNEGVIALSETTLLMKKQQSSLNGLSFPFLHVLTRNISDLRLLTFVTCQ